MTRTVRRRDGHGYLAVTSTPRWPSWAVCTAGARLPVAMAPLALILAGFHLGGGAAVGGALVAAHTLGEVAAAPVAGKAMDRRTPRRGLAVCLAGEATLFAALAALLAGHAGTMLLVLLAALAGAVPAGAPGGLRSALSDIVEREALGRALAMDTMINQAAWAVGPLVVGAVVLVAGAPAAMAAVSLPAAIGAVAALGLAPARRTSAEGTVAGSGSIVRLIARPLLLTAVWRLVFGVLTVAVIPLFRLAGADQLSGLALSAFAVGTAVGSVLYSARRSWSSRSERHADIALMALGAVLILTPLMRSAPALVALYGVAGLLEGPIVLARSLQLERMLPPDRRATGFSMQYAAIGIGFGTAAVALAPLTAVLTPAAVVAGTGTFVALTATIARLTDYRGEDRSVSPQGD